MTFDKRLEAHQKAFYWVQEINISLNSGKPEEMHNVANAAREWWNTSCLFLDMKSQKALMLTINLAHVYASEQNGVIKDFGIGNKVWGSLLDSSVAIVAGIGVKYLPEMNSDNNNAKTKTATG